jgi:hypothetical protein
VSTAGPLSCVPCRDIRGVRSGGAGDETLRRNKESRTLLAGSVTLRVVRGAGNAFEEPGALGAVGEYVSDWLDARIAPT